jgi:hypothetical protein
MNVMVVNGMGEIKFTVFSSEKRGTFIGFGGIIESPGKMGFNLVHKKSNH